MIWVQNCGTKKILKREKLKLYLKIISKKKTNQNANTME